MQKAKGKGLFRRIADERAFIFMMLPAVAYFLLFSYIPMAGVLLAFQDYFPGMPLNKPDWVGFKWFIEFFSSFYFWRLMRNTVYISFFSILFGFPVPILFALALNEIRQKYFKRAAQTISYLPYFISVVVVVGMVSSFLSVNSGIVNKFVEMLGGRPHDFLADPKWFRTVYISSGIWASFGFSAIIYISAITGISPELYEAATIDGANRLKCLWHITLPGIMQTVVITLILSLGGLLGVGYEKIILMYSPGTYETADVISSYVYRRGLVSQNYSFGVAVGLFNSVINFLFLMVFNKLSRKATEISLW